MISKILGNGRLLLSNAKVILMNKLGLISLIILIMTSLLGGVWYIKYNLNTNPSSKSAQSSVKTQDTTYVTNSNQVQSNVPPASSQNPSILPGLNTPTLVTDEVQQQALSLYDQGLKLYYQRDFSRALILFNKALDLDSNCYQALNGKGATYAFQGRYAEGIALIKQALKIKPDFEYGYFNLGLAYELAQNWTASISAYQTAIKLDAHDAWAYYGIASIYGRQGNVVQTVAYLKQAIVIEPDAKETAKTEHDFEPVRSSSEFQALLK